MEYFIIFLIVIASMWFLSKIGESVSRNIASRKAGNNLELLSNFEAHSYYHSMYGDVIAFNFMSEEVAIVKAGSDGYSRIIPMHNVVDPHLTKHGENKFSVYMKQGAGDRFGFGHIELRYYNDLKEEIDRVRALR